MVGSGPGFVAGTRKTVPVFLANKYYMQIVFSDNASLEMLLHSTPLTEYYQKTYKHLQHVSIPFREWDAPWYLSRIGYEGLIDQLVLIAKKINIDIDRAQCLLRNQNYFNHVHEIYEQQYDGNPVWLDFHEHIHMCEKFHEPKQKILQIDYREKAGMLEKSFDHNWLNLATTKINAGDVFVEWAELGKNPYYYWHNNESTDITRMCELIKPWLKLKPALKIAMEDVDKLEHIRVSEFEHWWDQHNAPWCKHYGIASWTTADIFSAIVIGRVPEYQLVAQQLENNQHPIRVKL